MAKVSRKEWAIEKMLFFFALSAISGLALIAVFIVHEGLPVIVNQGVMGFVLSATWEPVPLQMPGHAAIAPQFGILSMIVGSIVVTFGALLFGVPLGLASAIGLVEFCPAGPARAIKALIELLAGIPSVVYGFIGVVVLVPFIRGAFGGPGMSVLASSIVLGIMLLPSVVSISTDAMRAVPQSYREGSIALGATRWQTVHRVVLRAARSGILTAVILGMGRAVGETMAVIMVAGNTIRIPYSPLDPVRTLTSNIALEMGYASGAHRQALFATGIVLFIMIMILNGIATWASRRRA